MPVFGAADLDVLLQDVGVSVTYQGATVLGVLDQVDEEQQDPSGLRVSVRRAGVWIRTGATPAPTVDSAITVDGQAYRIRDVIAERPDGAYTLLTLAPQ
jgi:hypothetical protein